MAAVGVFLLWLGWFGFNGGSVLSADPGATSFTLVTTCLAAGVIVVGSVIFFDRIKIDDPVGAISVHLSCGIWGTLAVGIFSMNPEHTLFKQFVGVVAYGAFAFGAALALFAVLKATMGIRVSEEEEIEGLDLAEHGMPAYDFTPGTGFIEPASVPVSAGARPIATSSLATNPRS
jgi:Amt family ammonium transporter